MTIKHIIDEDFSNYKTPSMLVAFPKCSFKCEKECGIRVCQNGTLHSMPDIEIDTYTLVKRYFDNEIVESLVFGGLEPFDSQNDINRIISFLRACDCIDPVVIYTGYTEEEVKEKFSWIYGHKNIIIKFGRYIPNRPTIYDSVLGVVLASDNQYAKQIT